MRVFLDTEFTSLAEPRLLSLGLVADDGREHYVELDLGPSKPVPEVSEFVRTTVLPMWHRVSGATGTYAEMAHRTRAWLASLGPVEVVYDYSVDYELLERLLESLDEVSDLALEPVHVGYLLDDPDGKAAVERSLAQSLSEGLGEHHALADARALRARFYAVHGPD